MSALEISANGFNLVSVFLAGRNSIHTWWTGILGTILFATLFFQVKLYADSTLQIFFIATSILGWRLWLKGDQSRTQRPITRTSIGALTLYVVAAIAVLFAYGSLLHHLTDASYPFVDSIVLVFSIVAQMLLISRKLETWYFWILVDLVAVPLFFSKELYLTSAIYLGFLINACYGLYNWTKIHDAHSAKL